MTALRHLLCAAPLLAALAVQAQDADSTPSNPGPQALTGTLAQVHASGSIALQRRQAWTLPEAAVVQRDGRSYVFLVDAEGKAASRPVATGRRQDGRVEIVFGIEPTARVVARGGAFLADGTPVTVAATVASGAAQ